MDQYHDPKEPFGSRWTSTCQKAFEPVIQSLTTAPVLAFADPQKPYILHTDASTIGLGAVLYQEQEGQIRVIGYASRRLSRRRRNGDADRLSRRPQGMLADDLKSQKERERIQQFTRDHLSDPNNIDAVDQSVVKAICERQLTYSACPNDERERNCVALVETLAMSSTVLPDSYEHEEQLGGLPTIPHLAEAELAAKQRADQCIKYVISQIKHGCTPPPTLRAQLPDLPLLLRELSRLELRDNILYRRRQVGSQITYQLVLPAELRDIVLTSLHDHMGHMGIDRTLDLVRARFYWPKMAMDIERKVRTCGRNEVTGFSPYELMFGRQPRLAFKLPVPEGQHSSHSEYVQNLKSRLKESYKIAMEKAAKIAHKNKMRFDRHVIASDLEAGDRVLVRNVRIRGKHKISDRWEHTVHVVLRRAGTLPVYTVKPEKGDGPLRTLHRDLLLPCGYLPVEESSGPVQKPVLHRPRTRTHPAIEEEDSSNEDDVLIPVYLSPSVSTVCENSAQPNPSTTYIQDTQHTDLPSIRPVDSTADVDNLPDISDSPSDDPLIFVESNLHETDTEYLPIDRVTPTEQADETALIQNDLVEDDVPDIQEKQLPVRSDLSDIDEEKDDIRGAEPRERKEETDTIGVKDGTVLMDTDDSVRRSERNRQPPRRLDYTELGNPLLTAVKSFFQGLSTAWADVIIDDEEPAQSPALFSRIISI
ncbi:hypothetical protein MHYP_G00234610 [Metynnis hypsauchen]